MWSDVLIGLLAAVPACAVLAQVVVERQRREVRETYGPEIARFVDARHVGMVVLIAAIGAVIVDAIALVPDGGFPVPEKTVQLFATVISLAAVAVLLGLGLAAETRLGVFGATDDAVYGRYFRRMRRLSAPGDRLQAELALLTMAMRARGSRWAQVLDETATLMMQDPAALGPALDWLEEEADSATSGPDLGRLVALSAILGSAASESKAEATRRRGVEIISRLLRRMGGTEADLGAAAPSAFDALATLVACANEEKDAAESVRYLRTQRFRWSNAYGLAPSSVFQQFELHFGTLVLTHATEQRRRALAREALELLEQSLMRPVAGLDRPSVGVYLAAVQGLVSNEWGDEALHNRVMTSLDRLTRKAVGQGDAGLEAQVRVVRDAISDADKHGLR